MVFFDGHKTGGGAHTLSDLADGYWGPHDSLHTFCEPSYKWSYYVAEPVNAVSSWCYMIVGMTNLVRLYSIGSAPLSWRATIGWWSLIVVGIGSSLFHATMRYHMELLDEIPMLILVACGFLQISDTHPLGRKYRWRGIAVLEAILIVGLTVLTIVYLITRVFGIFITGFTVGTLFLLGIYLATDTNPAYGYLGGRAAIRLVLARIAWELENHLCRSHPWVWPLHNVWHFGSCLAASDLFLSGYYYRIDRLGTEGVVLSSGRSTRRRKPVLPMLLFAPASAKVTIEAAWDPSSTSLKI